MTITKKTELDSKEATLTYRCKKTGLIQEMTANLQEWFEDEESILLLGPLIKGKRKATLVYMDGITSKVELGDFNYTSKDYALKQDAWTFDPSTNSYYVAG